MKRFLLAPALAVGVFMLPAHANLLVDGDFSSNPGSGSPAGNNIGGSNPQYQYSSTSTNVGGTGAWTFIMSSDTRVTGGGNYLINTTTPYSGQSWIPQASANNTNGYVVQLDTTNTGGQGWQTGNAVSQTVTLTVGTNYSLTFSINTEAGGGKNQVSGLDLMITNANITNNGGAASTVLTSSATDQNALNYGNVTGYEYTVNTSSDPNAGDATTWQTYTVLFTATGSGTSTFYFADAPLSDNSNISLENVNLTTVPEPREWALVVLLGIGSLVAVRKLRNHFSSDRLFS